MELFIRGAAWIILYTFKIVLDSPCSWNGSGDGLIFIETDHQLLLNCPDVEETVAPNFHQHCLCIIVLSRRHSKKFSSWQTQSPPSSVLKSCHPALQPVVSSPVSPFSSQQSPALPQRVLRSTEFCRKIPSPICSRPPAIQRHIPAKVVPFPPMGPPIFPSRHRAMCMPRILILCMPIPSRS